MLKQTPPTPRSKPSPERKLTKDNVWGVFDEKTHKKISDGMIVANHTLGGFDDKACCSKAPCPIFGDRVPYKSVTVVCNADQYNDVAHWLCYVHGGECITAEKPLPDGKIALRSDYQCW